MAEPLKNLYSIQFFKNFTLSTSKVIPSFNTKTFTNQIFDNEWEDKEIKQRMKHVSIVLKDYLSTDFQKSTQQIINILKQLHEDGFHKIALELMFFPDYIETNGINELQTSLDAMEEITKYTSCEFAIRPFIIKYESKLMQKMLEWSTHENHHVRRLATEGCRPRLPWAMALPTLKKDPTAILPILETLKNDSSEYVRRSVANNLNDIAKDNPDLVIATSRKWMGKTKETDALVKHGCRTLLKQGNATVMSFFGFGSIAEIQIDDFEITTPKIKIGDSVNFQFNLKNNSSSASKIRLEYGVYYQKANGSLARKVFKISEKEYNAKTKVLIQKKQSFKIITTRKFHLGKHQISIIINGNEVDVLDFELW